MYFFVGNSAVAIDPSLSSITNYSNPIIPTGLESVPAQLIEYSTPIRVNIESAGMAVVTEIAYIAIVIVLLQIFLRIAMEETSFKSFWKYWYIPIFATLAWSGLFFSRSQIKKASFGVGIGL